MTCVGGQAYRFTWLNAIDWGLFKDVNPSPHRNLPHTTDKRARLNRGIATLVNAGKMGIRASSPSHYITRQSLEGLNAKASTHF
ncbi:hypothetical protein D3C76_1426540 [compost metagenome]